MHYILQRLTRTSGILANNLIAKELNIEISTVEKHLTNIYRKFNVKNREELKKNNDFFAL